MAKPIKETPVLKGKDAKNFLEEVEHTKHKKVSEAVAIRMKTNYDRLVSIAKF